MPRLYSSVGLATGVCISALTVPRAAIRYILLSLIVTHTSVIVFPAKPGLSVGE